MTSLLRQTSMLILVASLAACNGSGDPPLDAGAADLEPPPAPLTFDQLVEGCVRLAACDVARRTRLSDCIANYYDREVVYGWRQLMDRAYQCANQGGSDCKTIRECFGFTGKPTICAKETFEPRCEGEVAVTCDLNRRDGWEQRIDCARGKLKCALTQTGVGQFTAACGGGPCDQQKDQPRCMNRKKYTCRGSGWEINDCPEQGLQCRDPAVDGCEGTGVSCPDGNAICEGATWVNCVKGYLQRTDCATLPGKKVCDQAQKMCVPAGKECIPTDFLDVCEGDTLVACVDGFKRRFGCKTMGFLGCTPQQPFGAYCRGEEVYE